MNNSTISIRTLSISLLLAFASSAVAAAEVAIGTAANIAGKCYAVGGIYIAEGVTGTVYEALYEAENGKTVTFSRGTWGSSESAADHVDDLHFSGPGVLKVLHDQLANPLIIIVR